MIEEIKRKQITGAFENYSYLKARDEIKICKNKEVKIKLVKDEVSFTQAIRELYSSKKTSAIFCLSQLSHPWLEKASMEAIKNDNNKIYVISQNDKTVNLFKEKEVTPKQSAPFSKNIIFNALLDENTKKLLIITDETLIKEVYKNLDNVCNN